MKLLLPRRVSDTYVRGVASMSTGIPLEPGTRVVDTSIRELVS